jgi:excisionase family DNA binding protein
LTSENLFLDYVEKKYIYRMDSWMTRRKEQVPVEPLAVDIVQAAQVLSVSETTIYSLISAGKLRVLQFGRSKRIPMSSLRELVDGPVVEESAS